MHKPSFSVVTGVLVVLTIASFLVTLLRPQIPQSSSNRLGKSSDEFLVRGAHEQIDWRPLDANSVAEARRASRPILLLIGVSSNELARQMDDTVFTDTDVAKNLALNFTCLRVDGLQHPDWLNAFFPISRLRLNFQPGFQVWILDNGGHVIDFIGRTNSRQVFDKDAFLGALLEIEQQFGKQDASIAAGGAQKGDLDTLASQNNDSLPPVSLYGPILTGAVDPVHGAFPEGGLQNLRPSAWRYLCITGDQTSLQMSLDPVLLSPILDLQDGGFFGGRSANFQHVVFGKSAIQNAEMLETLAMANAFYPDRLYTFAAQLTYYCLNSSLALNGNTLAFQAAIPLPTGRSSRYSFSVSRLRNALNPDERAWAASFLGLDVMENDQMIPYLRSRATLGEPAFNSVLTELRATSTDPRQLSGAGVLEVSATVAAKMISAGRLSNNSHWIEEGLNRARRLSAFRVGADLYHRIRENDYDLGYLSDYLAYSEARLQQYISTGDEESLKDGDTVLQRAIHVFAGSHPGEFVLVRDKPPLPDTWVPEIADNMRESCSAKMIRLCLAYGRLTNESEKGVELTRQAYVILGHFAQIAGSGGASTAGYFCAAADALDDAHALSFGPDAVTLAGKLQRLCPARFVAPATESFAKANGSRQPGIYIVHGAIDGPYTLEQAQHRLNPTLQPATPKP